MTIAIGVFLLFTSSFILRNLFLEEKVVSSEKAAVFEKKQEYVEPEVIEKNEILLASSVKTPPVQSTLRNDENTVERDNAISSTLNQSSSTESAYKSMLVREHHKAMVAQKNSYKKAREEWRTALNEARAKAVVSGDYTKYEALKAKEPTKSKRSE